MKEDGTESEPGSRMLAGVPGLQWGRNGDTTFCGALEAATAVTAHPFDYNTLMGVTGLAFRTRWYERPGVRWCPSAPVGEFPDECAAATRATGWRLRCEWEPLDRLAPDVVTNIDAGLPALAYDDQLNVAVICGYEDSGATLLMKGYMTGDDVVSRRLADLKMMVFFLDANDGPMSPADAARMGIEIGVRHYRTGFENQPHDPPDTGYWHGPKAFEKWLKVLDDVDSFTEDERAGAFFINWWTFQALADARRQAVAFLRGLAPLFAPSAQEPLFSAADLYDEEVRMLSRSFTNRDAFTGPWTGGTLSGWTADILRREKSMLSCAIEYEEDAIVELEAAIS